MKNQLLSALISLMLFFATVELSAQVAINKDGSPPNASAGLDVKFTDKGLLPPRMTHAQMNAIENPADGLIIYCTDCTNSGAGALAMFIGGAWYMFAPTCIVPLFPSAGIHVPTTTQITWNWNPVTDAIGYKWNSTTSYTSAIDLGNTTSKSETGLTCNTLYSRYVWAYNGCGNSTATTLTQATTMNPAVSVSIAASANPVCAGTPVTYTATQTNGGTSPGYQWKKNGTIITGATNSIYSYIPVNSDSIRCQLTSTTVCSQSNPAWSNSIAMTVNAIPVPVITGSASVCVNSVNLTYTSDIGMTGYTWTISPGGTIVTTFQNIAVVSWNSTGSQWIKVNYTNSNGCSAANPSQYNVTVIPLPIPMLSGDTISCVGSTSVVYTTEAGKGNYVWMISSGGTKTAGGTTTSNTMTVTWNTAGAQTVSVSYRSGACTAATPTVLNVTVQPSAVVSVVSSVSQNPVNAGQSATFTAISFNGGSSPAYQWFVNGSLVAGATNSTYSYIPANGDVITCQLTSNVPCISGNPATSNAIAMIVNSVPNAPAAGTHTPSPTQIIWNWNTVTGATGYKWNTTNNYTTAIDMGAATTKTETGLTCNTPYTRYVWAYNDCGNSTATTLTQSTTMNPAASISIAASANPVCAGTSVLFTATPVNGGTTPVYQWKKNGAIVTGATNSTYSYIPANSDSLRCQLTASTACSQNNPTWSNSITMMVNPVPAAPTTGTHDPLPTQITWNWNTVAGAIGYKWNTTSNYAGATDMGTATTKTETGLTCSTSYNRYVWAYNNCGESSVTTLASATTTCGAFTCGQGLTINHVAGAVAPVAKTTTYGTVANMPGEVSKCWITSNLGSDHQATAVNDNTEASAGWYWQFNYKQGYQHDGITRTPNSTWITYINDNSDWLVSNDPCALELGTGWRIPTSTEWTNVNAGGSWTNWNGPWNSGLKLHASGYLINSSGSLYSRGTNGYYWSGTQYSASNGMNLRFYSSTSYIGSSGRPFGYTLRCLREACVAAPNTPTSGTHVASQTQIIWNWNPVTGATGYKWSTTNVYTSAIDMGTATTKTETGLTCNTPFTRYVWAYNGCGNSGSTPLAQSTTTAGTVSVSISVSSNGICAGSSVLFTATPSNGGTAPVYQWKVNGTSMGTNSATYSYAPVNNDKVTCRLTSNLVCAIGNPATSDTITMGVFPNIPVSLNITASINPVCAGTSVTFTAIPVNGGSGPLTQWYVNGSGMLGEWNPTFTYVPANGDVINCRMYAAVVCPSVYPAWSNAITMTVNTPPVSPSEGIHIPATNQIEWHWSTVPGTTGYKWNTTNNYGEAIDMGTATIKTEIGLTQNTPYTRYVWAYNACGESFLATILTSQTLQGYFIGQNYGGGIIIYIDGSGIHGLISATVEPFGALASWGCPGVLITGTSAAIGTGQANTTLIVNGCSTTGIAARICDNLVLNGYSDWFLPSKEELNLMYEQRNAIGGFTASLYMSSSEDNASSSWGQLFSSGAQNSYPKNAAGYVRAVRTF